MNFQERKIATGEDMINEDENPKDHFVTSDRVTCWSLLKTKVGPIEMNVSRENKNIYSK